MISKKYEVLITPTAKAKLKEIYSYSYEKWGEEVAKNYLLAIEETILRVASGKKTTRINPNFSSRFSYCICKSHYIFFQFLENKLVVATIFHTQMSIRERMAEEVGVIRHEIEEGG